MTMQGHRRLPGRIQFLQDAWTFVLVALDSAVAISR
jgi:hypothetical protein